MAGVRVQRAIGLDGSNVLRPGALRPAAFVVRHLLAFTEIVVPHPFDIRHVEEQVTPTSRVDETKPLVSQLLDCAFGHLSVLKKLRVTHRNKSVCRSPA